MPAHPTRRIFPTAKLMADNAGKLELSVHRRAVAFTSAALTAPPPPSCSSPLPESSPPPLTDTDEATDSFQTGQTLSKQRSEAMSSTLSLDSIVVVSPTTSDNSPINAPVFKKMKISPLSGQDDGHILADSSIINIDDIDNPCDERLNKSNPTADIKYFLSIVPREPGQKKRRMKCNLCA